MRLSDILAEKWDRAINPWGKEVDIYRNPSRDELGRLIKEHTVLRAFIDTAGNLFVWNNSTAIHHTVEQELAAEHPSLGGSLMLNRDGVVFNHLEDFRPYKRYAGRLWTVWTAVRNQPSLRRFYGDDIAPTAFDNENSKFPSLTPEWMEQNAGPDSPYA